ncbi:MAG: tRNA pseudouridine(38-40) synthase TruA [Robiginitalea sp.]
MRYFLQFSFFGQHYHGWQRQPKDLSVQEVLEDRLGTLLGRHIEVVAAGRTDAGVHARIMVAHFDWDPPLRKDLLHRLNAFLPEDIAVQQIRAVKPDAHARFDALSRTYQYRLVQQKDPFEQDTAFFTIHPLDFGAMNKAAELLLEYSDFQAFSRVNTDVKTFICHIRHAKWEKEGPVWTFTITADRFLRNMVRAVVGTLLEVGKGKITGEDVKSIIKSRDRSRAGASVPAKGLYLTGITYPESIYLTHGEG